MLRAMVRRINRSALQRDRARNLEHEVTEALLPLVIAARNVLQFIRSFATRFEITLTGGTFTGADERDHVAAPLYLLIPRAYVALLNLPEMDHVKARENPDMSCLRWDIAAGAIDFDALRILVNDAPALWATFAFATDDPSDATYFEIPTVGAAAIAPYRAALPSRLLTPRAHRTVWVLVSNLAHGGDVKSGNVVLFRRERKIDPTTGEQHLVPLFSGNATRGILRDIAGGMLLRDVGLHPEELPPRVAHALFSGGTIEAGADGATVDLALRRKLRELLPMWDVFGGVWAQQIMAGVLRMHDPIVVCRENAWLLYERLAPVPAEGERISYEAFKASLPLADDITQLRLGVRHAHRDIAEADGIQMLWNTETLLPGTRIAHSFQLQNLGGVDELTRSFVAHLLDEFRNVATIGAGAARGSGQVAFDPYQPGPGEEPLPPASIYLEWLRDHREEVRALLLSGGASAGPKAKRGGKAAPAAAEAP